MGTEDNKLIYEKYLLISELTPAATTTPTVPASPAPAGAELPRSNIGAYPAGTTFQDNAGQTYTLPKWYRPQPNATQITVLDQNQKPHPFDVKNANLDTAKVPEGQIAPQQKGAPQQPGVNPLGRVAGTVLGTDPAAAEYGGGMIAGCAPNDWLCRKLLKTAGRGVEALTTKGPERANVAVAHKQPGTQNPLFKQPTG